MTLSILMPVGIFARIVDVSCVVAETLMGSFGLLPHRLDCVAALTPGILSYTTATGTVYLAVDEGVLVKCGSDVTVSVRRCIGGTSLGGLQATVIREFSTSSVQDQAVRGAMEKMTSGFLGRIAEFHHER